MDIVHRYLGETFALVTAIIWGLAVILFKKSGESVHPIALNTYKNILAFVLFIVTMVIMGETLLRPVPAKDYWLLILSGALGIGIADTLFFKCLNLIGAGMTAIVDCLYSPFIISLSILWIGESFSLMQVVGVVLVISAVLAATHKKGRGKVTRRDFFVGLLYGVLGMGTMAVGIVMIKPLLNQSPLLWATEVRLVGGLIILLLVFLFHPQRKKIAFSAVNGKGWLYTLSGSFLGAYVAMILWLAGMKYTQASTAAALNQTSNIFIFIFAALFLKEPLNIIKCISIALAVIGILLITFG
ncbi:MAG: hypothetical protein DRP51_11175 [Candidatus Zixiibacteriota bacterium]|nr:MAG: hypothetical protein DRP51_11175 [candidate division Zixibacteria bacterium]HHI02693.1 DMT family transporter [candidate division Zixibacteria bacterium]